jgi:hypothetical protein
LAHHAAFLQARRVARNCEVCATLGRTATSRLHHLLIEERLLGLCSEHARVVRTSGADTLDAVSALFREATGKRSALPRRTELDRRGFPPRPEGRRLATGRRASDIE